MEMAAYQGVFRRYEIKFLITRQQQARLLKAMEPYMQADAYGRSTICNVYYDTPDYRLIRHSLERPVYKEKLRVRSYGTASPESAVFVELKKKYDGVVYKRRLALPCREVFPGGKFALPDTQIGREIRAFCEFYGALEPRMYLSYQRQAYFGREDGGFRITFDEDIRYRQEALSLCVPSAGKELLSSDLVLLEIKTVGSLPLWLVQVLSEEKIYKTSFSKYGEAYRQTRPLYDGKMNTINYAMGEKRYVG